jgi:hypothetical protein
MTNRMGVVLAILNVLLFLMLLGNHARPAVGQGAAGSCEDAVWKLWTSRSRWRQALLRCGFIRHAHSRPANVRAMCEPYDIFASTRSSAA